jgi:GDP-L-fucose synthase
MSAERLHAMGWRPSIALRDGVAAVYEWYLSHPPAAR